MQSKKLKDLTPNERIYFTYKDVVPIKYHHYLKEYEFEKNLPSIKERISKSHVWGDIF